MSKYKKPEFTEEELGYNPYTASLKIYVNSVKSKDKYVNDNGIWQIGEYEYEATPYTKLFIDSAKRKTVALLPSRVKDLLIWVLYEADKNKPYLWLNKQRYMEENGIGSINTYKGAVKELIRIGFLQKTVKEDVYWINPEYFFHGSRKQVFPDNVINLK